MSGILPTPLIINSWNSSRNFFPLIKDPAFWRRLGILRQPTPTHDNNRIFLVLAGTPTTYIFLIIWQVGVFSCVQKTPTRCGSNFCHTFEKSDFWRNISMLVIYMPALHVGTFAVLHVWNKHYKTFPTPAWVGPRCVWKHSQKHWHYAWGIR